MKDRFPSLFLVSAVIALLIATGIRPTGPVRAASAIHMDAILADTTVALETFSASGTIEKTPPQLTTAATIGPQLGLMGRVASEGTYPPCS